MREIERATIAVVDDTPESLKLIQCMLETVGYNVLAYSSSRQALVETLNAPPDLFILDITMPEMDGFELCEQLKAHQDLKAVPVIFISGLSEFEEKVRAFSSGGVDYVTKPFNIDEVLARVKTHLKLQTMQRELQRHSLHLEDLVQEKIQEISDAQLATITALANLAESRDDATGGHIERTQDFCRALAEQLRKRSAYALQIDDVFVNNLYFAAPLHDIGKVGIRDSILLKPGKLSPDEFEIMKTHVMIGVKTLESIRGRYPDNEFLNMGINITRYHHEKWDGKGYPEGLAQTKIPLCARIMALADVYDALRSRRPYKPPFSHDVSCNIIFESSGSHFDPEVVAAFKEIHYDLSCIRDRLHQDLETQSSTNYAGQNE
ncbi:MAG: response regulator [Candidatus Riflebacteria bacterium]|jgi:putative two-component system response regulator|nr:response regulator [Candidatus Riflebacteria bacterium]